MCLDWKYQFLVLICIGTFPRINGQGRLLVGICWNEIFVSWPSNDHLLQLPIIFFPSQSAWPFITIDSYMTSHHHRAKGLMWIQLDPGIVIFVFFPLPACSPFCQVSLIGSCWLWLASCYELQSQWRPQELHNSGISRLLPNASAATAAAALSPSIKPDSAELMFFWDASDQGPALISSSGDRCMTKMNYSTVFDPQWLHWILSPSWVHCGFKPFIGGLQSLCRLLWD